MGLFSLTVNQNGKENKEGRNRRQIWYPLWCLTEKTDQEDGSYSARQIHMQLLWQGEHEEASSWHLALQILQESYCWRSLRIQHNSRSHSQKCSTPSERNERNIGHLYMYKANKLGLMTK